jgi:hypothetical protein
MLTRRLRNGPAILCAVGAVLWLTACAPLAAGEPDLTFFGWSDQHIATNGDAKHLLPAIDAMNALSGTKYPERFGGAVARPAFVFGCGDITEWPTAAAKNAYAELIAKRLKFPAYDIAGNHDEGGKVPSRTVLDWIVSRHKSLSYAFDSGGVRFVAVFSKYDEGLNSPAQPLSKEALQFIRDELKKLKPGTPVVLAMHLCLDALTNRDELAGAIGKSNVVLVLGGHYHKATVQKYRGLNFVQLPSPAANGPGQFTVIRIMRGRVLAIPYDYRRRRWADEPGKVLDAAVVPR